MAKRQKTLKLPTASPTDDVASTTVAYDEMARLWELPRALIGGTKAMRAAGTKYLPMEPGESEVAYTNRLHRSTLFNAFAQAVEGITSKVFSKPIVLQDDVPERLKGWAEDVDLTGRNLDVFARQVFFDGLQTGKSHILADMPRKVDPPKDEEGNPARELLLSDEAGRRPFLIHVPAEDLIGWRTETVDGVEALTQIRIREETAVPHGLYGEIRVTRIRVIEPWAYQIFEREEGKHEFELVEEGPWTLGVISLSTFYANRTGFLLAEPPLRDLADLNAQHWQSSSDQRHILHFARVPILFAAGFAEDDGALEEIGPNRMIKASNADAKLSVVEHTGAAIEAGRQDLLDLEERMRIMGLEPLLARSGGITATAHAIDASEAHSSVKAMALDLKDALERSFTFMSNWAGLPGDSGGSIDVNTDFGVGLLDSQDVAHLISLRKDNEISSETLWAELRRRGVLSDDFDPDEEAKLLLGSGPVDEDDGAEAGLLRLVQ